MAEAGMGRDSGGGRLNLNVDVEPGSQNPDIERREADQPYYDANSEEDLSPESVPESDEELGGEEVKEPEGDEAPQEEIGDEAASEEEGKEVKAEDEFGIPDLDKEDPGQPGEYTVDLGNGRSIDLSKVQGLTPDQKQELVNRGLRMADYTRKTQEHAEQVKGAAQIWDNFRSCQQNPAFLLNHFSPQHLLFALSHAGFRIDPSLLQGGLPHTQGQGQPGQGQNQGQPQIHPEIAQFMQEARAEKEQREFDTQKNQFAQHLTSGMDPYLKRITNPTIQQAVRKIALYHLSEDPSRANNMHAVMRHAFQEAREIYGGRAKQKEEKRAVSQTSRNPGPGPGAGGAPPARRNGKADWNGADVSARRRMGG